MSKFFTSKVFPHRRQRTRFLGLLKKRTAPQTEQTNSMRIAITHSLSERTATPSQLPDTQHKAHHPPANTPENHAYAHRARISQEIQAPKPPCHQCATGPKTQYTRSLPKHRTSPGPAKTSIRRTKGNRPCRIRNAPPPTDWQAPIHKSRDWRKREPGKSPGERGNCGFRMSSARPGSAGPSEGEP